MLPYNNISNSLPLFTQRNQLQLKGRILAHRWGFPIHRRNLPVLYVDGEVRWGVRRGRDAGLQGGEVKDGCVCVVQGEVVSSPGKSSVFI